MTHDSLESRVRRLEADVMNLRCQPQVVPEIPGKFRIIKYPDEGVQYLLDKYDCKTLADLDGLIAFLKKELNERLAHEAHFQRR